MSRISIRRSRLHPGGLQLHCAVPDECCRARSSQSASVQHQETWLTRSRMKWRWKPPTLEIWDELCLKQASQKGGCIEEGPISHLNITSDRWNNTFFPQVEKSRTGFPRINWVLRLDSPHTWNYIHAWCWFFRLVCWLTSSLKIIGTRSMISLGMRVYFNHYV